MNEQAVVIVSFGTSVPEARADITAVEEALAAAVPGCVCVRAFTSPTIRRILLSRGEDVPGLTGALERLAAEGVGRVVVQPTLLLYGYEYDKLKSEVEAMAGRFTSLTVGRPLLSDSGDLRRFAFQLARDHPEEEGAVTVFMGHGTEHFAGAVWPALQTALRLLGRTDLYVGAMAGWPGVEDILSQLAPGGPRRVHLLPLMLAAGHHVRHDMAGDWKLRLEEAGHAVGCAFTGLGRREWVREMYRERLAETVEENRTQ